MKSLGAALVLAFTCLTVGARSSVASPCDDLAALSRRLADDKWGLGLKALEPTLHIEDARSSGGSTPTPTSSIETAIAKSATVVDAVGAGGAWTIFIEHVPSTDLYVAYTVQGTARCQEEIILRADAGAAPRKIDGPPTYGGELCLTESADLGEFRGRPAFVTHGFDQITDDQQIQITPWTGSGWGPACRLSLKFVPCYKINRIYCHDPVACRSASRVARQIAQGYDQSREDSTDDSFTFGRAVPDALQSRVSALMQDKSATPTPEFPTFGIEPAYRYPWSSTGFAFFALKLAGRSYIGGIGHEGVGWRENNVTLLAIYDAGSSDLKPVASFVVSRSAAKLKLASVVPPKVERGP